MPEKQPMGWKENIEAMKEGIEKEIEYIEHIEKRISKEIAWHHRDFHSVIKDSGRKMEDIMKDLEQLEDPEKIDTNTAAKLYEKIFDDLKGVDDNFMVAFLSTVSIMRAFSAYYKVRMAFNNYYEAIEGTLEADEKLNPADKRKVHEILEREKAVQKEIQDVVHRLDQITSRMAPVGPLIDASKEMRDILQKEGASAWVEHRRQMRKTAGGFEE